MITVSKILHLVMDIHLICCIVTSLTVTLHGSDVYADIQTPFTFVPYGGMYIETRLMNNDISKWEHRFPVSISAKAESIQVFDNLII